MIDAFIFDVDGTLADTFPLILSAFNRFALKYTGREWTVEELVAQFGPPETDIVGNQVADEVRIEAIEYYYAAYEELHDGTLIFDGIPELLDELERRGKLLSIYTGKGRRSADITLRKLGIGERFRPVVTGDDVIRVKPHPEGIIKVIDDLGINPRRLAMVGDNQSDILAGKAAGVYTIGALWHGYDNNALMAARPDVAFDTAYDMLEWVLSEAVG